MWTQDKASFEGKYYRIEEAVCEPKPLQKPHPPVWIGGGGERLLLKAVARHADGWNWGGSIEVMGRKLDALRMHCEAIGRRFEAITKS